MTLNPIEIQDRLERILPSVQKPGRYVGGELNQVNKNWEEVKTRVSLIFPDIYDIGIPNLGLAILYDTLNSRPDVLAERAYSPWLDMEAALRTNQIPLYSLESKHALSEFDIIGFSLPYESLYTNALNILDLAQIPIYSSERTREHPLIIAGGHATFNPEPMGPFIDAFVIGEGEEVIHEIVNAFQTWKLRERDRSELLSSLSHIPGVYVPSLYFVNYREDGQITSIIRLNEDTQFPIIKRITAKLPPPITKFIVPYIDVVHNRVSVEILRGCTRGCRFCHAGMVTRPIRERSVSEIVTSIEKALDATGYEEVSLLSLSSSDYTHITELVRELNQRFSNMHLSISLPSLRIESFSVELMDQLQENRPSGGFTLAPEAGTERLRKIINKPISTSQLIETAQAVYQHGWTIIKLYFMIGLPTETEEDIHAIVDLSKNILSEGRKIIGRKAKVHIGVGTFVPKAHTPFQWVGCDSVEQIKTKQYILRQGLQSPNIKLTWNQPESTMLEAWLARGDRRLSEVIYHAWKKGAKFDAWQDQFRYPLWIEAFSETGIEPSFYSQRQRDFNEIFPWDHINSGVRKSFLLNDYKLSIEGATRDDCRNQCLACGILPLMADLRFHTLDTSWKCPINVKKLQSQVR